MNNINILGLGQNSIQDYSKILNDNFKNFTPKDAQNASISEFEEIFSKQLNSQEFSNEKQLKGGINFEYNPDNLKETNSLTAKNALSIGQAFENSMNSLNQQQKQSENLTMRFAAGENVDVHEVMMASEKSGLAMNMALQVRNKLLAAYNEIYQLKF